MVFHTLQKMVIYPTLKLNNANIERVSQFNFHRVLLSSRPVLQTWDKHIGHVYLKVSRVIGVLFRLKHLIMNNNLII